MRKTLLLLFLPLCAIAATENRFVAMTTNPKEIKEVSPKAFDSIKLPVSLGTLVLLWGKAYASPYESAGIIHWYCSDGRSAMALPRSYEADDILSYKGEGGRGWIRFNERQDLRSTIIDESAAEQGAAANP
jgi:hypothetical protein